MAGYTNLSIAIGDHAEEEREFILDTLKTASEEAHDLVCYEWEEFDYWYIQDVDFQTIEKIQKTLLDRLSSMGIAWRAATEERDDFESMWWEEDVDHVMDPMEGFSPARRVP